MLVTVNGYEYRSTVAVMGGRYLIGVRAGVRMQHYHVDNMNAGKAPETRQRRIDRAVGLFLEGKQR